MTSRMQKTSTRLLKAALCLSLMLLGITLSAQQMTDDFHDPEQQYAYAVGLAERKFYDLAAEQFLAFVRTYGEHERTRQAWLHLIDCYNRLGKSRETEEAISEYRRRWPKSEQLGRLELLEADSRFRRGDYDGAAACYERASKKNEAANAECALYFLAQCREKQGRGAEARKLFEELAAKPFAEGLDYRYYAVYQVALRLLADGGQEEAAAAMLLRLTEALATPPALRREALRAYAGLSFNRNDYRAAWMACDMLVQEFPDDARLRETLRMRLKCMYYSKEYDRAVRQARDFAVRYPDDRDYDVELMQAASLNELGRHAEALELYRELARNPEIPERLRGASLLNAIRCLQTLARHQELIEAAGEYLESFPNSTAKGEVLFCQGNALLSLDCLDEAVAALSDSLESFVGDRENFVAAGTLLADCYVRRKEWAAASRVYHRLLPFLDDDGHRKQVRGQIVSLAMQAADFELAEKELLEILRLWPDDRDLQGRFLDTLFWVRYQMGHVPEARQALEQRREVVDWRTAQDVASLLAKLAMQQHDVAGARQALYNAVRKVQEWETGGARNLLMLFQLELQSERRDEAAALAATASGWTDEQLKAFATPNQLTLLGSFLTSQMEWDKAERLLRLAMASAKSADDKARGAKALAQLLLLLGRSDEAGDVLQAIVGAQGDSAGAELRSLLAEICLGQRKYDQALMMADAVLRQPPYDDPRTLARTQWVKAMVLFEDEKDARNALPLCLKTYVMLDDELYTPKAMELAIRLWQALGKPEEAALVWREMRQRFPARAAVIQDSDFVRTLPDVKE